MSESFTFHTLRVFLTVVAERSLTRAAERLGISQPAISGQLRILESSLGERLLERSSRGVRPTACGERAAEKAARILALADEMRGVSTSGLVRMCASSTPGTYVLPPLLRLFQGGNPKVELEYVVTNSRLVAEAVEAERMDLGVLGEYPATGRRSRQLEWMPWRADVLSLVASPRSISLKSGDLKGQTLLQREAGSSSRAQAHSLLGSRLHEFGSFQEPGSTEAIKECVIADLGLAVLPGWAIRREQDAGLLAVVGGLVRRRKFYLLRRRGRSLSTAAQSLWEFLEGQR